MAWLISNAMMIAYENSRCLQEQGAEYLEGNCSGGEQFVPSNVNPTPLAFLPPDKMTEFSRLSRFGTIFAPLTADLGEAVLTWFLEAFPAKATAQHLEGALWRKISGRKCNGSWQMSLPGTFLPRTPKEEQLIKRQETLNRWDTKPDVLPLPRLTWVRTTYGNDIGYLHTPTTMANYTAQSMQKHDCCRNFVTVFGKPHPTNQEWLMGWPQGWTDLKPLETDKFQSWRQQHGEY